MTMAGLLLPFAGLLAAALLWAAGAGWLGATTPVASAFAPQATAEALQALLFGRDLWGHVAFSLQRVAVGLAIALVLGIPLGVLTGLSPLFSRATTPLFQFARMISPLSWMPVAVMALGVGEAPVVFLIAFAAVWPIVLNVASGIQAIDPLWLTLADSLGANRLERLWRVTVPAIATHLLTGIRLAIGLIWVVLVPAEMLGVQAGLGYFILDTRDRMAYPELMATILFIGLLGFLLDWLARVAHRRWNGA